MKKNLNRKKLSFFNIRNLYYFIILLFISSTILIIIFHKSFFIKFAISSIENFSKNYDYQLVNLKINGLIKLEKSFIQKNLEKYLNTSIFLLPLDSIASEIKENNWIKKNKTTYKL